MDIFSRQSLAGRLIQQKRPDQSDSEQRLYGLYLQHWAQPSSQGISGAQMILFRILGGSVSSRSRLPGPNVLLVTANTTQSALSTLKTRHESVEYI